MWFDRYVDIGVGAISMLFSIWLAFFIALVFGFGFDTTEHANKVFHGYTQALVAGGLTVFAGWLAFKTSSEANKLIVYDRRKNEIEFMINELDSLSEQLHSMALKASELRTHASNKSERSKFINSLINKPERTKWVSNYYEEMENTVENIRSTYDELDGIFDTKKLKEVITKLTVDTRDQICNFNILNEEDTQDGHKALEKLLFPDHDYGETRWKLLAKTGMQASREIKRLSASLRLKRNKISRHYLFSNKY